MAVSCASFSGGLRHKGLGCTRRLIVFVFSVVLLRSPSFFFFFSFCFSLSFSFLLFWFGFCFSLFVVLCLSLSSSSKRSAWAIRPPGHGSPQRLAAHRGPCNSVGHGRPGGSHGGGGTACNVGMRWHRWHADPVKTGRLNIQMLQMQRHNVHIYAQAHVHNTRTIKHSSINADLFSNDIPTPHQLDR